MLYELLFNPCTLAFIESVLENSTLAMLAILALGLCGCAVVYAIDTAIIKLKK